MDNYTVHRRQVLIGCRDCDRLLFVHVVPDNIPRGVTLQHGDIPFARLGDVVCSECARKAKRD